MTPENEARLEATVEVKGSKNAATTMRVVWDALQKNLGDIGPFEGVHQM